MQKTEQTHTNCSERSLRSHRKHKRASASQREGRRFLVCFVMQYSLLFYCAQSACITGYTVIPNTVVKLCSADDTWWEAARESRSSPEHKKASHTTCFFCVCVCSCANFFVIIVKISNTKKTTHKTRSRCYKKEEKEKEKTCKDCTYNTCCSKSYC